MQPAPFSATPGEGYGGKGGGKADIAQGGGLTGDLRQILWSASGLLEQACTEGGS